MQLLTHTPHPVSLTIRSLPNEVRMTPIIDDDGPPYTRVKIAGPAVDALENRKEDTPAGDDELPSHPSPEGGDKELIERLREYAPTRFHWLNKAADRLEAHSLAVAVSQQRIAELINERDALASPRRPPTTG